MANLKNPTCVNSAYLIFIKLKPQLIGNCISALPSPWNFNERDETLRLQN